MKQRSELGRSDQSNENELGLNVNGFYGERYMHNCFGRSSFHACTIDVYFIFACRYLRNLDANLVIHFTRTLRGDNLLRWNAIKDRFRTLVLLVITTSLVGL
jgi:hypothetical protein